MSCPSPLLFTENICLNVIRGAKEGSLVAMSHYLEEQIAVFEQLSKDITDLEEDILAQFGCGLAMDQLRRRLHPVDLVVKWLQDIWCSLSEGLDSLTEAYKAQNLQYQIPNPIPV